MEKNLKELVKQAVQEGKLDQMMSTLKMEALKHNVSEEDLLKMIDAEKKESDIQQKAVEAASKNKYIIGAICTVLVVLEWLLIFRAHPAEGQSNHLFLTLIVNLVTLLVIVICAAVFFRKHN